MTEVEKVKLQREVTMEHREPHYSEALSEMLHLGGDARRAYLVNITTTRLKRWSLERGRSGSWCEVLRGLIVEELRRRGVVLDAS